MLYKSRIESPELQILKSLNNRMNFSEKEKLHFYNLKKGFEGEVLFDSFMENLQNNCLILNDLHLKMNNTTFQIDSLMLMADMIYLFEVKNYEGDFLYESDKFFTKSKTEIVNPLIQLKRTESLLHQLLQMHGFSIPIHASVVFVNPEFTLYQATLDLPFIFPTQMNRFLKQLNTKYSKITEKHKLIAEKLVSLHTPESQYAKIPTFDYDLLKKGITCASCHSFLVKVEGRNCVCDECGHNELVASAVLRSVEEFKLLFPDKKITTSGVHDWCRVVESKKSIRKILEKNYKVAGVNRWASYE